MASTKFTRRDLNRYKKTYPFVQRKPRYALVSDKEANMEVAEIVFDNVSSQTYTFSTIYSTVPTVTVVGYDSMRNSEGNADVAVMVSVLTTTTVTITASEAFRGSVFVQIISIGGNT